ncbi:hypothetical protein Tco_0225576, partial [Tanacetum coccineum]
LLIQMRIGLDVPLHGALLLATTKHIEIDIHFVRDLVTTGHIRVLHVPSRYQYVNIFTSPKVYLRLYLMSFVTA